MKLLNNFFNFVLNMFANLTAFILLLAVTGQQLMMRWYLRLAD